MDLQMNPFPTELWEHIIKNLTPYEIIRLRLSTVCRLLHYVVEPMIYDDIKLASWSLSKARKFYRSVVARPNLRALVHKLFIVKPYTYDPSALPPIHRQLALFPNLLDLELQGDIDAPLLSKVFDILPRLHTLHVSILGFPGDPNLPDGDPPNIHVVPLRSLRISGDYITHYTGALLVHFTREGYSHALTSLEIDIIGAIPDALLPCLLSTPSLLHLALRCTPPAPSHIIHTLPPDAIPLLAYFKGTAACSAVFVPGRPVLSVEIHPGFRTGYGDGDLRPLADSAGPVTALRVTSPGKWLQYAPRTLEHLTWGIATEDELLASFPHWPPLPHLEQVYGVLARERRDAQTFDRPDEQEIVHAMSAAYPSLRECVFFPHYPLAEMYAWAKSDDEQWECRMRI